jgi:GNAT superfamily N-acetyltransferase
LAQGVKVDLFDDLVLSKPYFEADGLIVAVEDGTPVGFVHAAFGPSEDSSRLDRRRGVISMLMVQPRPDQTQIEAELLDCGEQYLRDHGAGEILAIGIGPVCPFYLGLYGGSDLPGVLGTDEHRQVIFRERGYDQVDEVRIYRIELPGYRPKIDRFQMKIGRIASVKLVIDPPTANWWEACTKGCFEQFRADLLPKAGGSPLATAMFWNMESLAARWGTQTVGLSHVEVDPEHRQKGMATYLLGESLRQLAESGFTYAEGQAMTKDVEAQGLFEKLGFFQYGSGSVLRKTNSQP